MNRSGLIVAGAVGAVVVTAVLLYPRFKGETADVTQVAATPRAENPAAAELPPTSTERTMAPTPPLAPAQKSPEATAPAEEDDPTKIIFKADAKGRMVANQDARLNLERLYALYTPEERQRKLDEISQGLPAAAARDLADLMERYVNYDAAQRQTFPPGQELASPEEGLNMIDGMHNLRVQYFGADVANSFFAKEEKIQRELLKLMSLEKDQSMTIEEKAERAQALYQSQQMEETRKEIEAGRKQEPATKQRATSTTQR